MRGFLPRFLLRRNSLTWTESLSLFPCLSFLFLLILSVHTAPIFAQADTSAHKNVLVFYDENDKLPGLAITDQSIRSTLTSAPSFKIDVYSENLDRSRFQGDDQSQFLSDYFRQKYRRKKIDVIIAVVGPSLDFLLEHAEKISPGTPIVFCVVDRREIESRILRPNVTGVLIKRDFQATLDVALRLQPDTRQVVFIAGTSDFDKRLTEQAMGELLPYEERVGIKYLTNRTLDQLLTEVSQLPPDTIILISTVFRDGAGQPYVPHDVVSLISQKANVPVYGFLDQYLGRGIVGGHLYSTEAHGKTAAELALRILEGQKVAEIPIVEADVNLDMFDSRQLQRWGISEVSLPDGSIVRYKQPTVWEEYGWYAIGLLVVVLLEAILIGFLLYLRLRRRQAETDAARLSGRLAEIVSNVPGIVWESRTDPATNGRRTTFISDYVQKMLGYTPEEWLNQQPGFGLEIIEQEDRNRVQSESDNVIETGNEAVSEYRWFAKDGQLRWVENHFAPVFDGEKGVIGLRGVALDVTTRKLAEEKARAAEEKDRAILAAIPDLMFIQTADGVYLDYHAKNPDELLVSPELFMGKNMSEVLPAEFASQLSECFARVKDEGEPEILEYSLDFGEGPKWFEARMVRSGDKILSIVRDITEQKTAEGALKASELRLRMAQQAARVGTWEWDIASGASVWSEMIWELLGLAPNERDTTVETFGEFIHPEDRERAWRNINEVVADGEEYYDEFRVIRGDGTTLWLASKGALIRSDDGKPQRMLGVNMDITELKRTQLEAQEISGRLISAYEDERSRLAREIHDDLGQKIAVLSMGVWQLGQKIKGSEPLRRHNEDLYHQIQEISTDLGQLAYKLHPSMLNSVGLLASIKGLCQEITASGKLRVEFSHKGALEKLPEDVTLCIFRIAQEALRNCMKHSEAESAEVVLLNTGTEVRLSVSDRGRGIDMNGDTPGQGLGLTSMRERLRIVGGTMKIDSKPSHGTRLEVSIPLG